MGRSLARRPFERRQRRLQRRAPEEAGRDLRERPRAVAVTTPTQPPRRTTSPAAERAPRDPPAVHADAVAAAEIAQRHRAGAVPAQGRVAARNVAALDADRAGGVASDHQLGSFARRQAHGRFPGTREYPGQRQLGRGRPGPVGAGFRDRGRSRTGGHGAQSSHNTGGTSANTGAWGRATVPNGGWRERGKKKRPGQPGRSSLSEVR